MAYATGRPVCHACLRAPFEVDDIIDAVRLVYAGRMVFHAGEGVVAPGVTVHRIGGHTGGLQAVRVATGASSVRSLKPGQPMTMDYRGDRANVMQDAKGNIDKITCG